MTNKELLIESMMSEMKREVEKLVAGVSLENDVLDDVEKTARALERRYARSTKLQPRPR